MRFSVLMPAYNAENYISDSIESVISQTFEELELIIIDDGSSDSSGVIADSYAEKDSRIRVFHQENKGAIPAKRAAIEMARGEYCLFCDSDDLFVPNLAERVDETLRSFSDPDIIIYSYYELSETEKIPCKSFPWKKCSEITAEEARRTLIGSWHINPLWMKAIKRELLTADPLDYSVNYSGGYADDKLQSLYPFDACRRIAVLPEPLYCYRYNALSLIRQRIQTDKIRKRLYPEVSRIVLDYVRKWNAPGLEDEFYRFEFSHFGNIYKLVTANAGSFSEIKEINRFDWSGCLIDELKDPIVRKKMPFKTRLLGRMAMNPGILSALIIKFVYKVLKRSL